MAYQTSQGLASLGRNGDSVLVHMNPTEVAGLQSLAMAQGGSLTINPHTGLPEAFKLGGFFKSLLPTIAGGLVSMIPGMQPFGLSAMQAGILAGAATGALTNKDNPLMGAALGGLGGYGGVGIGSALKNTMAITSPAAAASSAGQAAVSGIGPGAIGTTGQIGGANLIGSGIAGGTAASNAAAQNIMGAMNNAGMNIADPIIKDATKNALQTLPRASNFSGVNMDPTSSFLKATPFDQAYGASVIQPSGTMGGSTLLGDGVNLANSAASSQSPLIAASMSNSPTPGFMETFVDQLGGTSGAVKQLGLPLGGAVLGGLEPSDLYGEPIDMDAAKRKQKYDPYATLNLSGDTGLRLYASGGTVATGGIRDLYGSSDSQVQAPLSRDAYGLGRLNQLGNEQSLAQAQTLGYAMGGPVSFADGGDSNKEDVLGLPSLSPDMSMGLNVGSDNSGMIQSAMQPAQGSTTAQGQMSDQSNDSLIAKVTANLKADPNYQPTNPIEASIIRQIKGTDPMQQGQPGQQGLGSLAPIQPMAPSYNPSVAMGPTYFAGINAPQGYADGGDVGDESIPNPEGVVSKYTTVVDDKGVASRTRVPYQYEKIITKGAEDFYDIPPLEYAANLYPGSILPKFKKEQMAKGGYLDGAGDGMSDSIPATIEGKQPARLADGEFVIPADVVSHLGNGSSKAGSKRLYAMLDKVRHARTGNKKQGKQIKAEKYLPA